MHKEHTCMSAMFNNINNKVHSKFESSFVNLCER